MAGSRHSQQAQDLDERVRGTISDLTEYDVAPIEDQTTEGFVRLLGQNLLATHRNTPRLLAAVLILVVLLFVLIVAGIVSSGDDDVESAAGAAVPVAATGGDQPEVDPSVAPPVSPTTSSTSVPTSAAPTTSSTTPPTTAAPTSLIRLPVGAAAESDLIDMHQGQMIWNQTATNVKRDDVTWWLAQVFARSEAPGGWFSVDIEARTISGVVSETWKCINDCENERWGVLDTGWKATIVDGILTPERDGWMVSGSVHISYEVFGGYQETGESVCTGGSCIIKAASDATTQLQGFILGDQVELRFKDGISGNLADMDFTALEETTFWMSRFAQTWTIPTL